MAGNPLASFHNAIQNQNNRNLSMSFKPTDEPYTVDGVTFYKEVHSPNVVHQDARFFAFTKSTNDDAFFRKFANDDAFAISYIEPGWGHDSPYREQLTLPSGLDRWSRLRYTFPPAAIAPHLSDFTVKGERSHWFADFSSTYYGLLVTARARVAIEELDPDNHYFFEVNITIEETGDPLPERRFYWKPRNVMRFKHSKPQGPYFRPPFRSGGAFSDTEVAWELKHNEKLRNYVADLPFWTLDWDQFNFGMSPRVFQSLKSEGFTGLVEIDGEDYFADDFDRNANVGYF